MLRISLLLAIGLCQIASAEAARNTLRLPAVLASHMVLQRDMPVPVWGWASPGESVTVQFAGQNKSATADAAGRWQVMLDPMSASAEPATLTVTAGKSVELKDVLVGDVWFCSGQSNMQMGLARTDDGAAAVAAANHPNIRLLNVPNHIVEPGTDIAGSWAVCTPESAERFSGVGYHFGLALHEELGVPIGLINSSWGATGIESWTPFAAMQAVEALQPIVDFNPERVAIREAQVAKYEEELAAWREVAQAAKDAGTPVPAQPRLRPSLRPQAYPGACFESMVRPLIPMALRGVVWYQGESNFNQGARYTIHLPVMIESWRSSWQAAGGQGQLPFGIVQLPNYRPVQSEPGDSDWAELREAQRLASRTVDGTGLVVTIDLGEADDGHPKNKRGVGLRAAQWALAEVYGNDIPAGGPVLLGHSFENGHVLLTFDEVGTGLKTTDGRPPAEFALAGVDGTWHWAQARTDGKSRVAVASPDVPNPVALRYAWADNPANPNLTNDSGLPASPFEVRLTPKP
ncbi:MAG: sialate O-acetylesterase [Phycisphaerae bacterium]